MTGTKRCSFSFTILTFDYVDFSEIQPGWSRGEDQNILNSERNAVNAINKYFSGSHHVLSAGPAPVLSDCLSEAAFPRVCPPRRCSKTIKLWAVSGVTSRKVTVPTGGLKTWKSAAKREFNCI